jgi:hypothetical protein
MLNDLEAHIRKAIAQARENENYMDLAGLSDEDVDKEGDLVSFKNLKKVLETGLQELSEEMGHVHDFNTENGMCSGCPADGNS